MAHTKTTKRHVWSVIMCVARNFSHIRRYNMVEPALHFLGRRQAICGPIVFVVPNDLLCNNAGSSAL